MCLDAGILTFLFGHDPRFEDDSAIARVDDDPNAEQPSFWALLEELGIVCTIPTFLIIVFQVGTYCRPICQVMHYVGPNFSAFVHSLQSRQPLCLLQGIVGSAPW